MENMEKNEELEKFADAFHNKGFKGANGVFCLPLKGYEIFVDMDEETRKINAVVVSKNDATLAYYKEYEFTGNTTDAAREIINDLAQYFISNGSMASMLKR